MSTGSDRVTVKAGEGLTVPLGFPSGPTLWPGGEAVVASADLDHPVVVGWNGAGFFTVPVVEKAEDDKAALVAEAKALGIDADGRWGVARLRAEIETAKAASVSPAPPEEEPAAVTAAPPAPAATEEPAPAAPVEEGAA